MKNPRLTASYVKDVLDFMNKYHLTNVYIDKKYEIVYDKKRGGYGLKCRDKDIKIVRFDKKEFIEEIKSTELYKIKIGEE